MIQRKNYGAAPMLIATWGLVVAIGLPTLIFGIGAAATFIKFLNSPIIAGSIPVWVILVLGFIVLLIIKRRRTHDLII